MKKYLPYLVIALFLSCTSNHEHDGKYSATVFGDANMNWVYDEQIELSGNEMIIKDNSITDTSNDVEYKTTCVNGKYKYRVFRN